MEAMLARLEAAGMPPGVVNFARTNPALLSTLMGQASLGEQQAPPSENQLQDAMKQHMETAQKQYERSQNEVPTKAPAPHRGSLIASQANACQNMLRFEASDKIQQRTTFAGFPKSFSEVQDYSSLEQGEAARRCSRSSPS